MGEYKNLFCLWGSTKIYLWLSFQIYFAVILECKIYFAAFVPNLFCSLIGIAQINIKPLSVARKQIKANLQRQQAGSKINFARKVGRKINLERISSLQDEEMEKVIDIEKRVQRILVLSE